MALLNGTSQRLKVHTHLCHLNFDGSYEVLGSSCAVLLSIEQALQDFSLAFELVLRLDFIWNVLEKIQDGEPERKLFFFFVSFFDNTLLIFDHDLNSHTNRCKTKLRLEERRRLLWFLISVTNQVAEDIVYDGKHKLCFAGADVLGRHHLQQLVDLTTINITNRHIVQTAYDSEPHVVIGHDQNFEKCLFTGVVEPLRNRAQ